MVLVPALGTADAGVLVQAALVSGEKVFVLLNVYLI